MANRSKRTLTFQQVIDLVKSIDVPVARIEKEIGIPKSVLSRAMTNEKFPLPVKYELPLTRYVKKHSSFTEQKVETVKQVLVEKGIEQPNKETTLSKEEMDNKMYWLNSVREAVSANANK